MLPQPGGQLEARTKTFELALGGLRFPPHDLQETLPQQLMLLAAARDAMTQVADLPGQGTGVFVGMEPDTEVCRYGLRWRQAQRLRDEGIDPKQHTPWLDEISDEIIPTLTSAGVVGTMPNIPANRLNSQFDLGGPSFSISAGENSGMTSLALAARALRTGEIDAALVAAVDLCCQEVHTQAMSTLEPEAKPPGDAAVVLVLKRLDDTEHAGDRIVAVLENGEQQEATPAHHNLDDSLGHCRAAGDLRDLAAGALCVSHRVHPDGSPWLTSESGGAQLQLGGSYGFTLRPQSPPLPALPVPRLHIFSAADNKALLADLAAGREEGTGPCRVVILASGTDQLEKRRAQAQEHIERGTPAPPGIHFRQQPIEGDLALVFAGAGSAYPGMGRELLQALPELGDALFELTPEASAALSEPWIGEQQTPALQRLWSSSALCQLHGLLSQQVLGLKPDAVIGYSSGESNSLFATGRLVAYCLRDVVIWCE